MEHATFLRGNTLMLASVLLYGSHGLWANLIGNSFGLFFQAWTRSLIILSMILIALLVTGGFRMIERSDRKWFFWSSLCTVSMQAPFFYAFITIGIGAAMLFFFAMWLLATYMVGMILLGEKLGVVKILAFMSAIGGLVLLFFSSIDTLSLAGILCASVTGIASGTQVVLTKKISGEYSPLLITAAAWFGVVMVYLPVSYFLGETFVPLGLTAPWLYQFGFACSLLLAFWLIVNGFKHVEASIGGLFGALIPVFSLIFGVVILGESVTLTMLVGGALIVGAALLPHHEKKAAFVHTMALRK